MNTHHQIALPLRFAFGVAVILVFSLVLFNWMMHPPMGDLSLMAQFLSITSVISGLAGYTAYRLGWIEKSPGLHITLLGIYALASGLTFLNVWITARLMFTSQHDLQLATVLLLFAGGIAMVLGYFLSSGLISRINQLEKAAHEIQLGKLDVIIPVHGRDELASLAVSFNEMAVRLKLAAQKQQEVETLRKDLIAWTGHDLQTPLASIRAIIEALADGLVEDPVASQRYLRTAQREIQNLSSLIDDLFQMAQLDAGGLILNREMASLSDLISDTLESFSTLVMQKNISLEGKITTHLDPINMDVQRIGRVLNNLIANALRSTPVDGKVSVLAASIPEGVRVEVIDTGEGISTEDLPYVFDRFYRGEKSRSRASGGAGLGLAIARGIIDAHHGQITVESQPGQGSRFYFILPNTIPDKTKQG